MLEVAAVRLAVNPLIRVVLAARAAEVMVVDGIPLLLVRRAPRTRAVAAAVVIPVAVQVARVSSS